MSGEVAGRYDQVQRRLIVALSRAQANPFLLLDHWLNAAPVRIGFTWLPRPDLDAPAWTRLRALHEFAKFDMAQAGDHAATLSSLLLFERWFPQDCAPQGNLSEATAGWDPQAIPAALMVRDWAKSTHPVYAAWSVMRKSSCCRLAFGDPAKLLAAGFVETARAKRRPL